MIIKRTKKRIEDAAKAANWFEITNLNTHNKIIVCSGIIKPKQDERLIHIKLENKIQSLEGFIRENKNIKIKTSIKIKTDNTAIVKFLIWEDKYARN